MSFLSYESTRPWAKAMKTAVLTKKMPPWFADPHFGKFANDRTMSQADIDTLTAWADTGAKPGDMKDAPVAIAFVEGWRIGQPDAVIEMPEAFNVPAEGTVDYQYVVIPTNFKEDKYVQFAEARPGNPALVHHILSFIREPGNKWLEGLKPGQIVSSGAGAQRAEAEKHPRKGGEVQEGGGGLGGGDFLAGYAPGALPNEMKPGQAKFIPAGSDIILQLHYTATGKAGTDKSRIGLIFAKEKPTERVLTLAAANWQFTIPANDPAYKVESKMKLYEGATLISLIPHMHFRGKDFTYVATYPTGEKETLLAVPKYDFNWQLTYELAQPKLLPKGTVIECVAHFDNSANNPANPDPTKEVHFGEQTWEEMMIGFFDVAVKTGMGPMDLVMPKKQVASAHSGGIQ